MRRLCLLLSLFVFVVPLFAGKTVNGKNIPTANDWSSFGNSPKWYWMDTLFTSLANILPSESKASDGINVDSMRTTTLTVSDSAYIDTLVSAIGTITTVNGTGGTFSDSVYIDTLNSAIGRITTVNGTAATFSDSVYIDTLRTQSLRIADPVGIDSISFKDSGSDDTLVIKINGRKFFIYPTRQE